MRVETKVIWDEEERETLFSALKILQQADVSRDYAFPPKFVDACDKGFEGIAILLNMDEDCKIQYTKEYGEF